MSRLSVPLIAAGSFLACLLASCSGGCDEEAAYNKVLALNNVQARLVSKGGESGMALSARLATESGPVHELIAQKKYQDACSKAEAIAAQYGLDLAGEEKDMVTYAQLKTDGGKGSGTCSIADAAQRQMALHSKLQAEVDAGRATSEVFRQFSDDTKSFGELLSTNPSGACELIDRLQAKYKVP